MSFGMISFIVWITTIVGYVIYNLYRKNVKLEDMLLQRDAILREISGLIEDSEKELEKVDRLGAFKSDDEIGFFFQTVKSIQEALNRYKF